MDRAQKGFYVKYKDERTKNHGVSKLSSQRIEYPQGGDGQFV